MLNSKLDIGAMRLHQDQCVFDYENTRRVSLNNDQRTNLLCRKGNTFGEGMLHADPQWVEPGIPKEGGEAPAYGPNMYIYDFINILQQPSRMSLSSPGQQVTSHTLMLRSVLQILL